MATPNFSAKLPDVALSQLDALSKLFGISKSQVVIRAISDLYRKEEPNMTTDTQTITIEKISTKPEHDPYTNIEGIVSKTTLKLDPRDRTVWVTQEYNDNSTPMDEWNGLVLTWRLFGHPSESNMREWINDNLSTLTAICDGFEAHWNGSNHVGRLSDDARNLVETIQQEFDADAGPANHYETWTVESWMESSLSEITAEMTNEQLQSFADAAEPDGGTMVLGDILKYITDHRDNLKWEADTYGDDE